MMQVVETFAIISSKKNKIKLLSSSSSNHDHGESV